MYPHAPDGCGRRISRMQTRPPARRLPWFVHLAILALIIGLPLLAKGPTVSAPAPPAELTTQQDHQRTMRLLGITSLRRGPSGDPNAPDASNADESKATPYTSLPDPLTFKNGRPVKTARDWTRRRAGDRRGLRPRGVRPRAGRRRRR